LGIASAVSLGLALVAGLVVIFPLRYRYSSYSLTQQAETFDRMLRRKSGWLIAAVVCFALGLVAFGVLLVEVMLYVA
jgi:hypothetical protein